MEARPPAPPGTQVHCDICAGHFDAHDVITLVCRCDAAGTNWCRVCLREYLANIFQHEARFPPQCSGSRHQIPVVALRDFVGHEVVEEFRSRRLEYQTSPEDRTYCSNTQCPSNPTFIPPDQISHNIARCPECAHETCSRCKDPAHGEGSCTVDDEMKMLLAMGDDEDWQRYYRCRNLVARVHGCNHMT